MKLITPSKWLADLTRESFLKEYPVEVKYNTIDKTIFKPTPSSFRKKYNLENKIIILGVASSWTERKGLYDFIRLSEMLDDRYVIVLVGITEEILIKSKKINEKKQKIKSNEQGESFAINGNIVVPADVESLYQAILDKNERIQDLENAKIICIAKTNNAKELAEIYTAADMFVNPTYEDTYPTVNLEAKACGTKIITYNVGGCAETLQQE